MTFAKRQRLMQYFIDTPYSLVKEDVDELTHDVAQLRWKIVEENFTGVCFRAGLGPWRTRGSWTSLMRKMVLLRDKAAEQPPEEEGI